MALVGTTTTAGRHPHIVVDKLDPELRFEELGEKSRSSGEVVRHSRLDLGLDPVPDYGVSVWSCLREVGSISV